MNRPIPATPSTRRRRTPTPHRSPPRQRGAALLIALVLVLVSTLLGISGMETSGVETRLVVNEAVRQHAFNVAEAASEQALVAIDPTRLSGAAPVTVPVTSVDTRVGVSAEVRHEGSAQPVGFSTGRFVDLLYSVQATATVGEADATEARRVVVQGAGFRVPAAP